MKGLEARPPLRPWSIRSRPSRGATPTPSSRLPLSKRYPHRHLTIGQHLLTPRDAIPYAKSSACARQLPCLLLTDARLRVLRFPAVSPLSSPPPPSTPSLRLSTNNACSTNRARTPQGLRADRRSHHFRCSRHRPCPDRHPRGRAGIHPTPIKLLLPLQVLVRLLHCLQIRVQRILH